MRENEEFESIMTKVERCIALRDNATDDWARSFWEKLAYRLSARYRGGDKDPCGKILIRLD